MEDSPAKMTKTQFLGFLSISTIGRIRLLWVFSYRLILLRLQCRNVSPMPCCFKRKWTDFPINFPPVTEGKADILNVVPVNKQALQSASCVFFPGALMQMHSKKYRILNFCKKTLELG